VNKFTKTKIAASLLHICAVTLGVAIFGAAGLLLIFLNPLISGRFGSAPSSLAGPNATTISDLSGNAKVREELWIKRLFLGVDHTYQDHPFADNMTGGPGSKKVVVTITDTEKVAGNTVNVQLAAGLAGPGVYGANERVGNAQKLNTGNFQVQIGRLWYGGGYQSVTRDETAIGSKYDQIISDGLIKLFAKKRSDDHMMRLRAATGTTKGARNLLLPDGISSLDNLKTANCMSTTLMQRAVEVLPGYGAMPINMAKDESGSPLEKFMIFSTNTALTPLFSEPAYVDAVTNGGIRGKENPNFTGEFQDWLGTIIYRWYNRDHANRGPIGSPLMPRAKLGVAITGATTSTVVNGGGYVYKSGEWPVPQYFEFFSNAPYTFWSGDTISADTDTQRYLMIINPDNSYGVFPYKVNDGHSITLSGAAITIGVGTETTDFVQNATIVECNSAGVPIGYSLALGAEALAAGVGSINGSKSDPIMGKRTLYVSPHEVDYEIGAEGVWGDAAVQRVDGTYPNFLVLAHALPVIGAPVIQ